MGLVNGFDRVQKSLPRLWEGFSHHGNVEGATVQVQNLSLSATGFGVSTNTLCGRFPKDKALAPRKPGDLQDLWAFFIVALPSLKPDPERIDPTAVQVEEIFLALCAPCTDSVSVQPTRCV